MSASLSLVGKTYLVVSKDAVPRNLVWVVWALQQT